MRMNKPLNKVKNRLRPLTNSDHESWSSALDERAMPDSSIRTIEEARVMIRKINPIRYWQMQRDFRWMQKQMMKHGLNPEDARYVFR